MIHDILKQLSNELADAFAEVNNWFQVEDDLLNYCPKNGGWPIAAILEHISLTNHYLLILIRKGTEKAIERAKGANYTDEVIAYKFDWDALQKVGEHGLFVWNRPEHMKPTRKVTMTEVKDRLSKQLDETLHCLQLMPNGEGLFYKTTMTVNGLGKIDVYHYIYFLVQHIKRHIIQMQKVKAEFDISK